MSDWQPIETAPKDGTNVVVFAVKTKSGEKRRSRNGCFATVAHYDGKWGWGWLSTPGDHQLHPTHWMPLAEPPENEARNLREERTTKVQTFVKTA